MSLFGLVRSATRLSSLGRISCVSPHASLSRSQVSRITNDCITRSTTILSVRKDDKVVIIGDGQVSMGSTIVKPNTVKVRRIQARRAGEGVGDIVTGFAGSTADCLALFERLEQKIEQYPGQLLRACSELAKDWRMNKVLRNLDALMVVCDQHISLMITGSGDVIQPQDNVVAIGSGGSFALAAARALSTVEGLSAEEIARRSMKVASSLCVYTNDQYTIEIIDNAEEHPKASSDEGSS